MVLDEMLFLRKLKIFPIKFRNNVYDSAKAKGRNVATITASHFNHAFTANLTSKNLHSALDSKGVHFSLQAVRRKGINERTQFLEPA